ncbi:TetR family transcriptional regulator, partial [Methylobacterium radiotolerans]
MTRRDRHKQERLDRIRAAAWDLFRMQGYEPTTIRQISERADVAVGTVNVL